MGYTSSTIDWIHNFKFRINITICQEPRDQLPGYISSNASADSHSILWNTPRRAQPLWQVHMHGSGPRGKFKSWLCPLWQVQIYDWPQWQDQINGTGPYRKDQINGSGPYCKFKSIALPLLTSSSLWFWSLWQDQSNGSGAYGKIKAMALALMVRSNLWFWPLWQDHIYGSGPYGKIKAMDLALSWAWVLTHLQWRGFCLARVIVVPWNHLRQRNRYQANLPTR